MPEITKTAARSPKNVPQYVWICLAALSICVYFFGLTIPFLGPDEARYAQVSREMFERGDWVTPTLGGFSWFEKPALLYWLQITAYNLFGVSEFTARLGPALFGLGTVASLWILGKNLVTQRAMDVEAQGYEKTSLVKSGSSVPALVQPFANYLALIAASTLGILVFSRGASFDIIVTFPLTAALVSFFIYDQSGRVQSEKRSRVLILFYVFVGLSLLAKGLIGVLFPFAIVTFYHLLSRRFPSREFILSLFWGTLVAVAVATIWYIPMFQRHGYEFVNEFFIQHHFQRFASNKYQHPQPFYFFLWVLPLMTLPWLPFFLTAILTILRNLFRRIPASSGRGLSSSPITLFSIAWILVPLAFFSFSGSKLPGYILPAVPAAIILTASHIFASVGNSRKWRKGIFIIYISTLASVVLLLVFAVPRFAETDSVKSLILAADGRGYSSSLVLTFYTISHNAEFYAAGRLQRDERGKQKKLQSVDELLSEIAAGSGRPVIVLVPVEHTGQLTKDERIKTNLIADNGELAVAVVNAK